VDCGCQGTVGVAGDGWPGGFAYQTVVNDEETTMRLNMTLAGLVVLALASSGFAQVAQPARPQPGVAGQPAGGQAATQQMLDSHVANCLILANQEEIALCRFAMEHADSDKTKEQAQTMIEDHEKFVAKLRKFASKDQSFELRGAKSSKEGVQQVSGTGEDRKANPVTTAAGTARAGNGIHDRMFAMAHQAHEECLRLTQECLSKYDGKEFDQAFLGQQVGMHIGMMAKLKAAEGNVSPEFQQVIKDGQKTAKDHKDHAEELMKKLADKKS
jgi:predicted outer membrane protein